MSKIVDSAPTHAPAVREHEERDDRHEPLPRSARLWALLGALGYASAVIDPTGVLAAQRLRHAEEEWRHGRR